MGNSLIIARYDEDVRWVKDFKNFNTIIYNKGKKLAANKNLKIVNLKNVGRESHTWLYHIVTEYNNLDDNSIFLQGRIDDLGCMAYSNPSEYLKKLDKYGFHASRLGLLTPLHWKYNVGIETNLKYASDWQNNKIGKSDLGFRKFAKTIFPKIPKFIATSYGGCFSVKKEIIKKYDVSFYRNLLQVLSEHPNPIEGHYMERLWCYMFTQNNQLFDSFRDVILTKIERSKFNFLSHLTKKINK